MRWSRRSAESSSAWLTTCSTAVAERARAAGTTRLYWHTHESNHTARRLYDAVAELSGFIVYRREL
jgi:hypothetical protein